MIQKTPGPRKSASPTSDPAIRRTPSPGAMWQGACMAIEQANRAGGFNGRALGLVPCWADNPWSARRQPVGQTGLRKRYLRGDRRHRRPHHASGRTGRRQGAPGPDQSRLHRQDRQPRVCPVGLLLPAGRRRPRPGFSPMRSIVSSAPPATSSSSPPTITIRSCLPSNSSRPSAIGTETPVTTFNWIATNRTRRRSSKRSWSFPPIPSC